MVTYKKDINSLAQELLIQEEEMRVDTLLCFFGTSNIIDKFLDINLKAQPITRAAFNVLHLLITHDGNMIQAEISRKTLRSKHAVSKIIDTLEKSGFVKRLDSKDEPDRRVKRVVITQKGLDLVNNATIGSRTRLCKQLFRSLDDKELKEFNGMLRRIRRSTNELIKEYKQKGNFPEV